MSTTGARAHAALTRIVCITFLAGCAAQNVSAQAPVVNAKVETRSAAQGLTREVQAVAERGIPIWVGYRVPIVARRNLRFDNYNLGDGSCCGRCRLEPPTELVVLARYDARTLVGLRAVGVDCDIDAAGMPLVWLNNVDPDQSVAWLASLISDSAVRSRARGIEDAALMGVALHAAPSASRTLVRLAREHANAQTRSRALFWVAQRAADQSASVIVEAIDRDPEVEVKKKAVFALSQLPNAEGIPLLINVARNHRSIEVKRQAMFWLGQSKDPRALDFLEQILLK